MSQKTKKSDQIVFIPGSAGWEIWAGSGEMRLVKTSGERQALAVEGIPSGELLMAFPVRDVSAAPFIAATGDAGMFRDLASLHLERSGLRANEDMGTLTDCFVIRKEEEEALLLPILLSPPVEGNLPKKSPKAFDVSARLFPYPPSAIVLWREFGRWVFAVSDRAANLVYFQALPGAMLDQQMAREVKLGISQLTMQGILTEPSQEFVVWTEEGDIPPSPEVVHEIASQLSAHGRLTRKPAPAIPAKFSELLPADIRAERVARQKTRQTQLVAGLLLLAYLAGVGFLGWKFYQEKKLLAIAQAKAANSSPEALAVQSHLAKWEELKPLVENNYSPVNLYFNAYQAAPKEGLRITRAEMNNQLQPQSGQGQALRRSIEIQGNSDKAEQALTFAENLKRSAYFSSFDWNTGNPQTKDQRWSFTYTASTIN